MDVIVCSESLELRRTVDQALAQTFPNQSRNIAFRSKWHEAIPLATELKPVILVLDFGYNPILSFESVRDATICFQCHVIVTSKLELRPEVKKELAQVGAATFFASPSIAELANEFKRFKVSVWRGD